MTQSLGAAGDRLQVAVILDRDGVEWPVRSTVLVPLPLTRAATQALWCRPPGTGIIQMFSGWSAKGVGCSQENHKHFRKSGLFVTCR